MKGRATTLEDFGPETPTEIVERIQQTAADAVDAQGVTLDV